MTSREIVKRLESLANADNVAGMNAKGTLGVPIPVLRKLAREIGKDHALAAELWATGIHEARMLAGFIDDPRLVTARQMDRWVRDFDSWDVCDQVVSNLFDKTEHAYAKAFEWSGTEAEFVKRAGFVMMAALAVHDKRADDAKLAAFLPVIEGAACDERNFVKKAVNWALRQIGKRSRGLNRLAVESGRRIQSLDSRAARWIAADALRELTGEAVQAKLKG